MLASPNAPKTSNIWVLGDRIRQLRSRDSLTQGELIDALEKIGVSIGRSYISRLEGDIATRPSSELLLGLAQVFEVSTDFLLGLIGEPVPLSARRHQLVVETAGWEEAEEIRGLVTKFKALPEDARHFVTGVVERELER